MITSTRAVGVNVVMVCGASQSGQTLISLEACQTTRPFYKMLAFVREIP